MCQRILEVHCACGTTLPTDILFQDCFGTMTANMTRANVLTYFREMQTREGDVEASLAPGDDREMVQTHVINHDRRYLTGCACPDKSDEERKAFSEKPAHNIERGSTLFRLMGSCGHEFAIPHSTYGDPALSIGSTAYYLARWKEITFENVECKWCHDTDYPRKYKPSPERPKSTYTSATVDPSDAASGKETDTGGDGMEDTMVVDAHEGLLTQAAPPHQSAPFQAPLPGGFGTPSPQHLLASGAAYMSIGSDEAVQSMDLDSPATGSTSEFSVSSAKYFEAEEEM